MSTATRYTCFDGTRRLGSGTPAEIVRLIRPLGERPIQIFDDHTGRPTDLDLRGTDADIAERYPLPDARGRGRPRLGVTAREVTLLPRHWDWLAAQPGGASVALRKLVDEARRSHAEADARRRGRDRCFHFLSAIAGDYPGFEEAVRALYAGDDAALARHTAEWPPDIREHLSRLQEPED